MALEPRYMPSPPDEWYISFIQDESDKSRIRHGTSIEEEDDSVRRVETKSSDSSEKEKDYQYELRYNCITNYMDVVKKNPGFFGRIGRILAVLFTPYSYRLSVITNAIKNNKVENMPGDSGNKTKIMDKINERIGIWNRNHRQFRHINSIYEEEAVRRLESERIED